MAEEWKITQDARGAGIIWDPRGGCFLFADVDTSRRALGLATIATADLIQKVFPARTAPHQGD